MRSIGNAKQGAVENGFSLVDQRRLVNSTKDAIELVPFVARVDPLPEPP